MKFQISALMEGAPSCIEFPRERIVVKHSTRIDETAIIDCLGSGKVFIDENCLLRHGALLLPYGGSINLAKNVTIGAYTVLYGHGGLYVGQDTQIGPQVVIIPANHITDFFDKPIRLQGETRRGIKIGDNVWIGAGAIILDGVVIEDGAVVAAGAVVTGRVPKNTIVGGVPARFIRMRGPAGPVLRLYESYSDVERVYRQECKLHFKLVDELLRTTSEDFDLVEDGERALPGDPRYAKSGWCHKMLARYFFTGSVFCHDKHVLDACSGLGWGAKILSNYAASVTCIEQDAEISAKAAAFWKSSNISWVNCDALNLDQCLLPASFDVVTAMEAIEHFNKKDGYRLLEQGHSVLKDGGYLVASSYFPISRSEADICCAKNPFHLYIYTKDEILSFCSSIFSEVKLIGNLLLICKK